MKLTELIQGNRAAFDEATPPQSLWKSIESALDKQQKVQKHKGRVRGLYTLMKVAATVILVIIAGGSLWYSIRNSISTDYSRINAGLALKQEKYTSLIELKRDSLEFIAASNPILYREFSNVLQVMEQNYDMLKAELKQSPNKQLTLEAMIRNLQAQMEVLSQQLQVLNNMNKPNKKI